MERRLGWQAIRNQVALQPEAKFYDAAKFDRLQRIGYRMQPLHGILRERLSPFKPFKSFKRFKTFETEWSD
jgi:hypothetical protein